MSNNDPERLSAGTGIPVVCEYSADGVTQPPGSRTEARRRAAHGTVLGPVRETLLLRDALVAQTLVRSFLVIVLHERTDGGPQVLLAELARFGPSSASVGFRATCVI